MATYVNDLRLKEISTGDESGTWGTSTNTNLELIGEALGYATQQVFSSDADATTTVADGASDPARAMYFKITSAVSLTATRTCTIAPNTVSRVMFIENATSGSQSIAISQGSGANVTIATGKTAVVYLDGAGSGAAVVDAMAGVDPGVTDTLAEVLTAGNTTTTDQKIQFRDSAIYINSSADGQLDLVADTEIQIAATTVDINGNLDVSGTTVSAGKITADAGIDIDNINIDGTTIALSSGDLTIDVAGRILLDADTDGNVRFLNSGTLYGQIFQSTDMYIRSTVADKNLIFQGNDNGINITALTLDMSASGAATFNGSVLIPHKIEHVGDADTYLQFSADDDWRVVTGNVERFSVNNSAVVINEESAALDFRVESNSNSHMLFVDGDTNRIGINEASPGYILDIKGGNGDQLRLNNGGEQFTQMYFQNNSSNIGAIWADNTGNKFVFYGYAGKGATIYSNATERVNFKSTGEVVFNDSGADYDFRVESDTNANMLFVDAGNDVVNIGTSGLSTAGAKLAVQGPAAFNTDSGTNKVYITRAGGTDQSGSFYVDDATFVLDSVQDEATLSYGGFLFRSSNATNSNVQLLNLAQTESRFNDDGADIDFRVESDSNANALFVDAGNSRVGINTVPNNALHVAAGVSSDIARLDNNAGGYTFGYTTNLASLDLGATDALRFRHGATETLRLKTTESVFNELSADIDFRVESNNNAAMLSVDGGADLVTISGGSKVTNEVLRVNGPQVVGAGNAGLYSVGILQVFTASAAKYLRIQQDGSIFGGLTITATGDYSNVNAIGCFQKVYSIGANSSNTTLFSAGNTTLVDLGSTSGQFSMGTPTKPNATTIYIPLTNLNSSYTLSMSITVELRGYIDGISAIDIIAQ